MLFPLALGFAAVIGAVYAFGRWGHPTGDGVLPAYPRIVAATPAQRAAIIAAAKEIPAAPAAFATVIQSESGWDTTAPKQATGTPRAGLNQITQGAHMPGLSTADAIWAVRSWSMEDQLTKIVVPFFQRVKAARKTWRGDTALDLYKVNFLPALASMPDDYHLGERDSAEKVAGGLTKGQIYAANPGFDPGGKKYFTWADVGRRIAQVEAEAKGKVVDIAGAVRPAAAAPQARARVVEQGPQSITGHPEDYLGPEGNAGAGAGILAQSGS